MSVVGSYASTGAEAPAADTQSVMVTFKAASAAQTITSSAPENLMAVAAAPTAISLKWNASTLDNMRGVTYPIFRNGVQIGTAASTSYDDIGLTPTTSYSYTIAAINAAGNRSAKSAVASATTQTAGGSPSPITRVQFKSGVGVLAQSVNVTLPNSTVAGNELIVAVSDYSTNATAGENFSISDSYHNAWRTAIDYHGESGRVIVYYAENIANGPNHELTVNCADSRGLLHRHRHGV